MGKSDKKHQPDFIPLEGADFCVRLIDMDYSVHGVTAVDEDDYHSIYLNARDSIERQQKAYQHELLHVRNRDFDKPAL